MSDVAALEVRELHKYFGTHEVLKGIDMTAHKGDVISLIGSSGSGSRPFFVVSIAGNTLFRHCSVHGEVSDENQPGWRAAARICVRWSVIRSRLAMVFQSFNLWST